LVDERLILAACCEMSMILTKRRVRLVLTEWDSVYLYRILWYFSCCAEPKIIVFSLGYVYNNAENIQFHEKDRKVKRGERIKVKSKQKKQ
jgi:hypothetical protein